MKIKGGMSRSARVYLTPCHYIIYMHMKALYRLRTFPSAVGNLRNAQLC